MNLWIKQIHLFFFYRILPELKNAVFKNKQVELTSCLVTSTGDINFVFYDNQNDNFYRFTNVFVKDKDNNLKLVNCYGLNQEQQYYNRQMR